VAKKYGSKSVLVIDNGVFVELAIKLSADFGMVRYYSPWEAAFPVSEAMLIGEGVPGIKRVNDWYSVIDDTDLFVFPDIYWGGAQVYLEERGHRVWGSRKGEELEIYRDKAKVLFKSLGLPQGAYEVIIGFDDLRKYLKANKEQWVKITVTRGDMETFFSKNYDNIEPKLDELEYKLGAKKHIMKFIVEEVLKDKVEIGYDGYTVDGEYPSKCMTGIEVKDLGYCGYVRDYDKLPKEITGFNEAIAPTLKKYQYRNFFSTELRVGKDHKAYMIDLCCRAGSPPSELYMNMIDNLSEVIWEGAAGKCVDPEYNAECGVQIILHSSWADNNYQAIQFPEKYRDNIKIKDLAVIKGNYYAAPISVGMAEFGSVVASGKDLEEASEKAMEIADQVEGYYIDRPSASLEKAQEEFKKLEEYGVKI
jgi:hypothetical protein